MHTSDKTWPPIMATWEALAAYYESVEKITYTELDGTMPEPLWRPYVTAEQTLSESIPDARTSLEALGEDITTTSAGIFDLNGRSYPSLVEAVVEFAASQADEKWTKEQFLEPDKGFLIGVNYFLGAAGFDRTWIESHLRLERARWTEGRMDRLADEWVRSIELNAMEKRIVEVLKDGKARPKDAIFAELDYKSESDVGKCLGALKRHGLLQNNTDGYCLSPLCALVAHC